MASQNQERKNDAVRTSATEAKNQNKINKERNKCQVKTKEVLVEER
jgi:hypothetical protein